MPHLRDDDVEQFAKRARAYVQSQGITGPDACDLVQAMVLDLLEHPPQHEIRMSYIYLHALDTLDPRRMQQGVRFRDSERTQSLEPTAPDDPGVLERPRGILQQYTQQAHQPQVDAVMETLPAQGRVRAMLLLTAVYGYTQQEVGVLFGLTESRVCQLLRAHAQQCRETPMSTLDGERLAWRPLWITL